MILCVRGASLAEVRRAVVIGCRPPFRERHHRFSLLSMGRWEGGREGGGGGGGGSKVACGGYLARNRRWRLWDGLSLDFPSLAR